MRPTRLGSYLRFLAQVRAAAALAAATYAAAASPAPPLDQVLVNLQLDTGTRLELLQDQVLELSDDSRRIAPGEAFDCPGAPPVHLRAIDGFVNRTPAGLAYEFTYTLPARASDLRCPIDTREVRFAGLVAQGAGRDEVEVDGYRLMVAIAGGAPMMSSAARH